MPPGSGPANIPRRDGLVEDGTNDPYRPDSAATIAVADRAEVYAR